MPGALRVASGAVVGRRSDAIGGGVVSSWRVCLPATRYFEAALVSAADLREGGVGMALTTHTRRQLSYAQGYLELGMKKDAAEALKEIDKVQRKEMAVLILTMAVHVELADWKRAEAAGKVLCEREPEVAGHWIQWAYATRRHVGIAEAREILLKALGLHPREAVIHFNLACYEAQLGHLDDARVFLDTACGIDETFVALGQTDEDLAPLRG